MGKEEDYHIRCQSSEVSFASTGFRLPGDREKQRRKVDVKVKYHLDIYSTIKTVQESWVADIHNVKSLLLQASLPLKRSLQWPSRFIFEAHQ